MLVSITIVIFGDIKYHFVILNRFVCLSQSIILIKVYNFKSLLLKAQRISLFKFQHSKNYFYQFIFYFPEKNDIFDKGIRLNVFFPRAAIFIKNIYLVVHIFSRGYLKDVFTERLKKV